MSQANECIWCQAALKRDLIWQQIFCFKPLSFDCLCPICRSLFIAYHRSDTACQTCGRAVTLCEEPWENVFSHEKNYMYGFEVAVTKEGATSKKILCFDCVRWLKTYPIDLLTHDALLEYGEVFREWLYRYKYRGDYRLRQIVAEPLKLAYQQYKDYQWLILPSSPKSLQERRFHATAGLLDVAGIPFVNPLTYIGDGIKQSQKTRLERLNLLNPFDISHENLGRLSRKLLIFDDVYTTGATLMSAKHLLTKKDKESAANTDKLTIKSLSLARDSQSTDLKN